jgi:ribonucleoside-diphosphate reductase alpha chain
MQLLKKGYFQEGESSWEDIAKRVSKAISKGGEAESCYYYEEKFYKMISEMEFIPSTPCLINAGTENGQLSSCFIIDIKDNIESIYEAKSWMAKIFQKNGGVGLNISVLRPINAPVETSRGKSCGTLGFMEEFDLTADVVTRNNLRKGALKIDLCDWHPDIIDFIKCKDDTTKYTRMNISVALSDRFMNAVKNDANWTLEFPDYSWNKKMYDDEWDGDIVKWKNNGYPVTAYKTLKATDLYRMIMEHAWKTGEPGVSFIDTMDRGNPNPNLGKIKSTNPCSEFCSIPFNSCNLGSVNLSMFVNNGQVDYPRLGEVVEMSVMFLDNMLEVNKLPLENISEITRSMRSIGLGTMGLADLLYKIQVPYGSTECLKVVTGIYTFIQITAIETSKKLAKSRGCYGFWKGSTWERIGTEIRNSNLLSIAPNGSISFIANTSGGLEPNFSLCYTRRMNDGTLFKIVNPIFEELLRERRLYSDELMQKIIDNNGSCQGIDEIPKEIRDVFLVSSDITPEQHLSVLAAVQKNVDLSCSKTINLPNSATINDIEHIFMNAWENGVKGVTIYRDGSRDDQTLSTKRVEKEPTKETKFDSIEPISKDELGETYGVNVKRKIACGRIYINVCKDKNGNLVELFINTGKGGICQSNINSVSRLVSMALRGGIKVEEIIDQLKGIVCPACTVASSKGEQLSGRSCADVIAQVLLQEYNKDEVIIKKTKKNQSAKKKETPIKSVSEEAKCPECGGEVKFEGGCMTCLNCGFSKCG